MLFYNFLNKQSIERSKMKSEKSILIAFILNLSFSVFEYLGAALTGSVALMSDALHDIGDALSIGASFLLERKSKKRPDDRYTYGYARYSVFGGVVTTLILLTGSGVIIYNAIGKIIAPESIDCNTMLIFALIGVAVNLCATFFTRGGTSINQKAVNLHMLEDVLGWVVVLAGTLIMRFTGFVLIDPLMSIGISAFIVYRAIATLKEALDLFLEKAPLGTSVSDIKSRLRAIDGVLDVHHVHVWSLDGIKNYATLHIVTETDGYELKEAVRKELENIGINHATLELEKGNEYCSCEKCNAKQISHEWHNH